MAERPRLLFVAPWFLLPPTTGGKIRSTEILRGLKGGMFEVTLASPANPDAVDWSDELASLCDRFVCWQDNRNRSTWKKLLSLASDLPVSVALDRSADGSALVAEELGNEPDVVVVDFVHSRVLLPEVVRVPRVVFTHNVENEIFRRRAGLVDDPLTRWVWRRQAQKMKAFESEVLGGSAAVVAVSDRDRDYFRSQLGVDQAEAIPTGIDLDRNAFREGTRGGDLRSPGGRLVFTGSMNWHPNIDGLRWFMNEVWPKIAARSPSTELTVVGNHPDSTLVDEVERAGLPWKFTGFVDDVRPYVWDADLFVIPLRIGGGTRLKVCEAMALGCPVVSTALGVEGLPVAHEEHYLEADTAEDFAGAVLRQLEDEALRRRLASSARSHAESQFSSRVAARVFESICRDVVDATR